MRRCPECESEKIVKSARVLDRDEHSTKSLNIAIDESPDAFFFSDRMYTSVEADVCGECGFVQMYVQQPEELWASYMRRPENSPQE